MDSDWGEPWIYGFPDGREREFFKSVGFATSELIAMDGPEARSRSDTPSREHSLSGHATWRFFRSVSSFANRMGS